MCLKLKNQFVQPKQTRLKRGLELSKIKMDLNILIAEDNDFTSKQYKMALEKKGHKVTLTKDGEECFDIYNDEVKYYELFKKQKNSPFDIVLLDQNMPRRTGTETAKDILKLRRNQRKIIL